MPAVEIRPAKETDIPLIVRFDHSYTTDHVWQMDAESEEGQLGAKFRQVRLPRAVRVDYPRSPKGLLADWPTRAGLLVAVLNGEVVGYSSLMQNITAWAIWVTDLVVAPGQRRRGIASALVFASLEWTASHSGDHRLVLEMQLKNHPAIALARKLGFDFCGYVDHHYANRDAALFFAKWVR